VAEAAMAEEEIRGMIADISNKKHSETSRIVRPELDAML
jgi:hypothetical protein